MEFVSLVGSQVMSVVNPFLVLKQEIERVFLLATPFSQTHADAIRNDMIRHGFSEDQITVIPISSGVTPDEAGRPPAHRVVSRLIQEYPQALFNLAGGMNFQIAACVSALSFGRVGYVYPDSTGVHLFQAQPDQVRLTVSYPLPAPQDVLALQGIAYTQPARPVLSEELRRLLTRYNSRVVRFQPSVTIGNLLFDLIFNDGNQLCFIKIIEDGGSAKSNLKADRALINFALQRGPLGQLYHRRIIAITDNDSRAERLSTEGGGKIEILSRNARQPLTPGAFYVPSPSITDTRTGSISFSKSYGDCALAVVLGREVMPTITAIYTHKPDHLILLYTPADSQVVAHKESLVKHVRRLPVKHVSLLETDIIGMNILELQRPAEAQLEVNVTPGAKSQCFFLTLWAGMHGGRVYSITDQQIAELPDGTTRPCAYPGLADLMALRHIEYTPGRQVKFKVELKNRASHYETLLEFLRLLKDEPDLIGEFPMGRLDTPHFTYQPHVTNNECHRAEVRFKPTGKQCIWKTQQTEWFEDLVGYVMGACGAQDVAVRLKIPWSDTVADFLVQKYHTKGHRTEIDVVALYKGSYYVISCKLSKAQAGPVTSEAIAMSSLFGRFAIPLVCVLKYTGAPHNTSNGVYQFGINTLTDKTAMKELLETVRMEAKTTVQAAGD